MVFSACKYPHGCKRSHSLHLQPSLFRWLHHPPCGLDLPLLLHRLCRLGQGLTAQVVVQVLILTIVYGLVGKAFPEPCLQMLTGCPSQQSGKQSDDSALLAYSHDTQPKGKGHRSVPV